MRAVRLRAAQIPELYALLREDIATNLFLLDLLETRGLGAWSTEEWYGVWHDGALIAAALIVGRARPGQPARLGVAYGDTDGCREIGARARWGGPVDMLIGPRAPSDALWAGLAEPQPAKVFYEQRLYLCTAPTDGEALPLRVARPDEAPLIEVMSAEMMREDLGVDPRETEPARHRLAVQRRVEEGRTLVGEDEGGAVVFVLEVGTCRAEGAQVGGTYVPPAHRGKGLAIRGMRAAVQRLLDSVDSVSLHVNEANTAAVRCYERVGFVRGAAFRLLIR